MPTINIYSYTKHPNREIIKEIKALTTQLLSCQDITLKTDEISVRLINTPDEYMIADLEIEIKAHSFPDRIEKQDQICLEIRDYLIKKMPEVKDIKVWLILSELGHSR